MNFNWIITPEDEKRYREFVAKYETHSFVKKRFERNINRSTVDISLDAVWEPLVGCLLTTQQRSGPRSRVSKFVLDQKQQLCSFAFCCDSDCLEAIARPALAEAGLRFSDRIAVQITDAIKVLRSSSWQDFQLKLQSLNEQTNAKKEREVAKWIQEQFQGFGPKQSRNLLQWLGLSQHEIPLDSRMMKVLKGLGFPVPLSAAALADEEYYCFVEDGLHTILARIEVAPCIFDACAFASFESDSAELTWLP